MPVRRKWRRKSVGRPFSITEEKTKKLEAMLKIGGTIEESCAYAGANTSTYYDHLARSNKFAMRMQKAKFYSDVQAKNVIVEKIVKDKDDKNARWWLEKRQFKDTAPTVQVQLNQFNMETESGKFKEKFSEFIEGEYAEKKK